MNDEIYLYIGIQIDANELFKECMQIVNDSMKEEKQKLTIMVKPSEDQVVNEINLLATEYKYFSGFSLLGKLLKFDKPKIEKHFQRKLTDREQQKKKYDASN